MVRRRRSRESDAGSGKRRLIFCPSPFAAARLPFAPPSSLPIFCARSVCPPYLFLLLLCFHGLASLFPGLLPARPGFRTAIPGENLVRPGFSAWRNPALLWAIPGRPGVPSSCRIGPGESGPLPAMDPTGTWGPEGGAAASGPSNGISNGISSGISNGTRVRRGWEAGGGRSDASGFPRAAPQEEASPAPGSGSGLKTPAMDPAGTRGLEAARWSHGRVTVLITVLATARVGGTGQAGGRSGAFGFPRAAPWEKAC